MKRQAQHCPVARAVDLLAEPWTLLIIRELALGGRRATEIIRGLPRMSSSMLSSRLRTLMSAGLVERLPGDQTGSRYRLTAAGGELRPLVDRLGRWGSRWLPPPSTDDLDADLLLFDIARQVDRNRLPVRPVAVRISLHDGTAPRRWWLTVSRTGAVASERDPGIPLALCLDCSLAALADVWLGHLSWWDAIRTGVVRITGDGDLIPAFIGWVGVSRYTEVSAVQLAARPGAGR